MTQPGISSLSLNQAQVAEILTAWLNGHLLRIPHQVRDIEYCDGQFNVSLAPAGAPDPEPVPDRRAAPPIRPASTVHKGHNKLVTDQDVAVMRDVARQGSPNKRAEQLLPHLPASTIGYHMTKLRKEAARTRPAPFQVSIPGANGSSAVSSSRPSPACSPRSTASPIEPAPIRARGEIIAIITSRAE